MLSKESMPKADVVAGTALIALGVAVIVGAMRMPMGGRYGGVNNPWYASPAMLVLLVGGVLVLLSAMLVIRAIRRGGLAGFMPFVAWAARRIVTSRATYRGLLVWVLLGLYAGALYWRPAAGLADVLAHAAWLDNPLGRFLTYPEGANYVVASCVFLGAFIWLFYRPDRPRPAWWRVSVVSLISLLVSLLVGYSFSELLNVPLP